MNPNASRGLGPFRRLWIRFRCWKPERFANPFYSPSIAAQEAMIEALNAFATEMERVTTKLFTDLAVVGTEALSHMGHYAEADKTASEQTPPPGTIMHICNRCGKIVPDGEEEYCWYCPEPLCYDCWDTYGHCGHTEAEEMNKKASMATEEQEQRKRAIEYICVQCGNPILSKEETCCWNGIEPLCQRCAKTLDTYTTVRGAEEQAEVPEPEEGE